jgi:hypothetical protein
MRYATIGTTESSIAIECRKSGLSPNNHYSAGKLLAYCEQHFYVRIQLRVGGRHSHLFEEDATMYRTALALLLAAAFALGISLQTASQTQAQEKTKDRQGQLTFEIYKDAKDAFRWRLKSANGQVVATGGQAYKAKSDCEHGIQIVKDGAAKAKVVDSVVK